MTKILVIDDDPLQVELMSTYLAHVGYQAVGAGDTASGIAAYREQRPDVVLCDLAMPGGGGLVVLEVVRADSPFVPFVVISGTNDLSQAVDALKRGAWDYLLKPLAGYELLPPLVNRLLERSRLLRENAEYQARLEDLVQERTFELVRQLREKDDLLAEVHHRVKNNLQLLLSLLDAERRLTAPPDDPWARWDLTVRSLALVQEELHAAAVGSGVPFESYLTSLVQHTIQSKRWSPNVSVTLDVRAPNGAPAVGLTIGLVLLFALEALEPPATPWTLTVTLERDHSWNLTVHGTAARWATSLAPKRDLDSLIDATGCQAQFHDDGLAVRFD